MTLDDHRLAGYTESPVHDLHQGLPPAGGNP